MLLKLTPAGIALIQRNTKAFASTHSGSARCTLDLKRLKAAELLHKAITGSRIGEAGESSTRRYYNFIEGMALIGMDLPALDKVKKYIEDRDKGERVPMFVACYLSSVAEQYQDHIAVVVNTHGGHFVVPLPLPSHDFHPVYDPDAMKSSSEDSEFPPAIVSDLLGFPSSEKILRSLTGLVIQDDSCQSTTKILMGAGLFEEVPDLSEAKPKKNQKEEDDDSDN